MLVPENEFDGYKLVDHRNKTGDNVDGQEIVEIPKLKRLPV
jgi:hypothetical protein